MQPEQNRPFFAVHRLTCETQLRAGGFAFGRPRVSNCKLKAYPTPQRRGTNYRFLLHRSRDTM